MTEGQRQLTEAYARIADLVAEPSHEDWEAWICKGRGLRT